MRVIQATIGVLGCVAILGACGVDEEEIEVAVPQMPNVIAPTNARESIAEQRCKREAECGNIGSTGRFASREHCLTSTQAAIAQEMAYDTDCNEGVERAELRECLAEIALAQCAWPRPAFDSLEETSECDADEMCSD